MPEVSILFKDWLWGSCWEGKRKKYEDILVWWRKQMHSETNNLKQWGKKDVCLRNAFAGICLPAKALWNPSIWISEFSNSRGLWCLHRACLWTVFYKMIRLSRWTEWSWGLKVRYWRQKILCKDNWKYKQTLSVLKQKLLVTGASGVWLQKWEIWLEDILASGKAL